ncbi:NTP transferase domain-containing protein [Paenibacillus sp. FSL H8-0034]|uniref:NTP transferase domain-containing protein n=1 Tax=Paenibacillus sp. FSL H8-0034 TaxID=2954671 RepID=UPI0030F6D45B
MSIPKTIVISCAGVGSRLGMGTTKALIKVLDKPIIEWQLELLKDYKDIRIVVGFQAKQVIETVLKIRKDITFVFNHNYLNTGTGASFSLGALHSNGIVVSLDGDLLVHPEDFNRFLSTDEECLGYCNPSTEEPVFVDLLDENGNQRVTSFSRSEGKFEWTGLLQLRSENVIPTKGHVFEMIINQLPLKGVFVRATEIDTPKDYESAIRWIKENY